MGFKEDMARLQKNFKLLEREYEQWFSGALPTPPFGAVSPLVGHSAQVRRARVRELGPNGPSRSNASVPKLSVRHEQSTRESTP